MDIKKLEVFINLVETRNYTKTAEAVHVTQPTVTHDIKALEDEIGVKLFNRNKRFVNVTEDGKNFYKEIKPLINSYYSAIQSVQRKSEEKQHQLIIGYSYTPFNDIFLPKWIRKFKNLYPDTEIVLRNLNHNDFKHDLLDNRVDLVITTGRDAEDLPGMRKTVLFSEQFKAIVPKNNTLASKKQLNIEDLSGQSLLFLDNTWAAIDLITLQNKIKNNIQDTKIIYANDISALNMLIKSEQGIALGLYCLYHQLEDYLEYVPLNWQAEVELVLLAYRNNQKQRLDDLIRLIKQDICQNTLF